MTPPTQPQQPPQAAQQHPNQQYHIRVLKDHLYPKWRSPRFHTRTQLRKKIQRIISDNLTNPQARLLDFGCGDKPYQPLFQNHIAQYLGADIPGNPHADIIIDPESGQLPLDDNTIDVALSVQVLEHIPEPQDYLRQAHRVLKPDAPLILSTHGIWPYHPDPCDYHRWTGQGLQYELEKAGFQTVSIQGILHQPSVALQLWQDALAPIFPRYINTLHHIFFQRCIGITEYLLRHRPTTDSAIFLILARKA